MTLARKTEVALAPLKANPPVTNLVVGRVALIPDSDTRDAVVLRVGDIQPSLADIITLDGENVDMTNATVVFFMRPLLSRTPVIDSASAVPLVPPDNDGHNVRYDWQTSDTAVEGNYMAWWGFTLPSGALIETPEFRIVISDHGPGFGTTTGVVVDGIAQWMPVTLRALRDDLDFGDRFLQGHADYVKRIVMGSAVAPDLEASYDPALIEYLSKRTALRLITPAKDYWGRQYRQVLTQGPSESATYPDMLQNLDELERRLRTELAYDWLYLQRLVPGLPQNRIEPSPISSLGDPATDATAGPVTGDPQATPPARTGGPRWIGFPFP